MAFRDSMSHKYPIIALCQIILGKAKWQPQKMAINVCYADEPLNMREIQLNQTQNKLDIPKGET